jgi:hypothetical protein
MNMTPILPREPAAILPRAWPATGARTLHRGACLLVGALVLLLPAVPVLAQATPDAAKAAATKAEKAQLLDEVSRQMLATGRYSAKQVDAVVAQLQGRDMSQIRDMALAKGSALKGAERLIGASGDAGRAQVDQAGALLGSSGVSARTGGSVPKEVQGGPPGGGFVDRSGFASANAGCEACPGTYSGRSSAGAASTITPTGSATTSRIEIYADGSARISYSDGTHEYLNNQNRLVDERGAPIPDRTPRPDGAADKGGTRVTMADVRGIEALRSRLGIPNPEKTGAGGGPVDTVRASPTTTTGLYVDPAAGTYVSEVEMAEILRIALEKLGGPVIP